MDRSEVDAAFDLVEAEIGQVINTIRQAGSDAFQRGDYRKAEQAAQEGERLQQFLEKVKQLHREWDNLSDVRIQRDKPAAHHRRSGKRLPRGFRTPEQAFRRPILEALVELGGSASVPEVLHLVEVKLRDVLNDHDRQLLPSKKGVRWRNTAQWCRKRMVREGLLRDGSKHGVWEITERGREALKAGKV